MNEETRQQDTPQGDGPVRLKSGATVALKTPKEAAEDAAEPSMGEWNLAGKLLYFGHLCWLLQEFFWILLISYPALIFGFLATVLVAIVVYLRRDGGISGKIYNEKGPELLVNVVQLGWLGTSFINCLTDLVFASRQDTETPDYAKNLVRLCSDCQETYDALIVVVQVGFGITFGVWLACCCYLLYLWLKPPILKAQGYAFQTILLEGGWIAFWVLADFARTFDGDGWFAFALVAWCIHFILLIAALVTLTSKTQITLWNGLTPAEMEALGDVLCRVDLVIISYVLWSLSDLAWSFPEYFNEDAEWRWVAAIAIGLSILLFIGGYRQAKQRGMILYKLKDVSETQKQGSPAPVIGAQLS